MAIIPDEIPQIEGMSVEEQIKAIQRYLQYMREQIDFWASQIDKKLKGDN